MQTDVGDIERLPEKDRERLALTGLEVGMQNRCGSFFQIDQNVIQTTCGAEGIEMIPPIKAALEKYDWVKDYYWNAVPKDKDKYTEYLAKQENPQGLVVIAHEGGVKVEMPLQACLFLRDEPVQHVHNLFIAREGSEINIISGCASSWQKEHGGAHIGGVTEIYVAKAPRSRPR